MKTIPRMSLHLRLQHGALILAALGALGTGYVIAGSPVPAGMDLDLWYRVHQWSGMAALTLIGYHATYLFVRGYLEGRNWSTFPLGWKRETGRTCDDRPATSSAAKTNGPRPISSAPPRRPSTGARAFF